MTGHLLGALLGASAPTPAYVWNVHDGDTVDFLLKLPTKALIGRDLWADVPGRLAGCNARELAEPGGQAARANLAALLPVGTQVELTVVGTDKYATRMDVAVTMPDGSDLVAALIGGQWAAAWDGRGPKPVPPWPRTVTEVAGG